MGDEDIIPPQPNLPQDGDETLQYPDKDAVGSFFKKINAADTTSLEKPGDPKALGRRQELLQYLGGSLPQALVALDQSAQEHFWNPCRP